MHPALVGVLGAAMALVIAGACALFFVFQDCLADLAVDPIAEAVFGAGAAAAAAGAAGSGGHGGGAAVGGVVPLNALEPSAGGGDWDLHTERDCSRYIANLAGGFAPMTTDHRLSTIDAADEEAQTQQQNAYYSYYYYYYFVARARDTSSAAAAAAAAASNATTAAAAVGWDDDAADVGARAVIEPLCVGRLGASGNLVEQLVRRRTLGLPSNLCEEPTSVPASYAYVLCARSKGHCYCASIAVRSLVLLLCVVHVIIIIIISSSSSSTTETGTTSTIRTRQVPFGAAVGAPTN